MDQTAARALKKSVTEVVIGAVAVGALTFFCFELHIDVASASVFSRHRLVMSLGRFRIVGDRFASRDRTPGFLHRSPVFFASGQPLNALALLAFLVTLLIITTLVSRIREEAGAAKMQKDRLNALYQLSQQLLALEPDLTIGVKFLGPFRRFFQVTAVRVFDLRSMAFQVVGGARGALPERTREAYIHGRDVDDRDTHVRVRCLRVGTRITGAIGFKGLHDPAETAGL